jgi:putative MATE family efflux protein
LIQTVKEALSGSLTDFTEVQLRRGIILLAIPMMLEMVMESLLGVVDMFWVARLGVDSLATVALTESILVLVFGVAMGLATATTAFVARRVGESDIEGAGVTAVQAILLAFAFSTLVGAAGIIYGPQLLSLMGASESVVRIGGSYTRMLLGGSITIFLLFLINAVFRGAGDPALAMRSLWIANIVNMILDPCLIFGLGPFPRLNVFGASIATTTGRGVGVLFQLWMLFGGYSRIRVYAHQIRIRWDVMRSMVSVSFNAMMQMLISSASWTALVRANASFGSAPIAGYTVAIKIFMFVVLPPWGLSGAVATMVGQNLGAKKPERAEAAVYLTGRYASYYMAAISVIMLVFAPQLAAIFTSDEMVLHYAAQCLRFVSLGNLSYGWGMVLVQGLNGAGDTRTPTLINLFCYWCFQIPLAYTLALGFHWGPPGVFIAVPAAETLMTIASLVAFRRGAWKHRVI